MQETAFAGVWRVRREDARGAVLEDILEAGDMPAVAEGCGREGRRRAPRRGAPARGRHERARPSSSELRHHAQRFKPGTAAHVVNLSLLPLAPADHEGLDAVLGEGPVAILSRGFGNCRINATQRARHLARALLQLDEHRHPRHHRGGGLPRGGPRRRPRTTTTASSAWASCCAWLREG